MKFEIIGLGLCALDQLVVVPSYSNFDEKISASDLYYEGGGAASTALALLASLGVKTKLLSAVGNDPEGKLLIKLLKQRGVDCEDVHVLNGGQTPRTIIIVSSDNGKAFIITWQPTIVNESLNLKCQGLIKQASIIHLDSHFMADGLNIARDAKKHGVIISVDAGRKRAGMNELLEISDILITSKTFALEHCSCNTPEDALDYFRKNYKSKVIGITLQEEGVICWSKETGVIHSPGFLVNVLDDSSAGDLFHGAFLYGYLKSWSLEKTVEFANATASRSCLFLGGRKGIPDIESVVWDFLKATPRRPLKKDV